MTELLGILCKKQTPNAGAHQNGLRCPLGQAPNLCGEIAFLSRRETPKVEAQGHSEPDADHVMKTPDPAAVASAPSPSSPPSFPSISAVAVAVIVVVADVVVVVFSLEWADVQVGRPGLVLRERGSKDSNLDEDCCAS